MSGSIVVLGATGKTGSRLVERLAAMGVSVRRASRRSGSGRHKLERQVKASGLEWTILRPSGFFQNFSEGFLLPGILSANQIVTAAGDGAVSFVDANDIAAVAAAALTEIGHSNATYAITGSSAVTFSDVAATISRIAKRHIAHRNVTSAEMLANLARVGVPNDYADVVVKDQEAIRDGHATRVTNVVAQITGRPAISFAEYVEQAAGAWRRD